MSGPTADDSVPTHPQISLRTFLAREWPYLLMVALALFGIAVTSVARSPMTLYWVVLAPFIGIICVITRWRDLDTRDERLQLIWTQALHWGAVLVAMHLMFLSDVASMMNADAGALAVLILLALGTFTAGVHIWAWRICLVGLILGIGVPGIAWLEQSAFLLLLAVLLLIALAAPVVWSMRHRHGIA